VLVVIKSVLVSKSNTVHGHGRFDGENRHRLQHRVYHPRSSNPHGLRGCSQQAQNETATALELALASLVPHAPIMVQIWLDALGLELLPV
jgi:hypothetical protein